MSVPDAAEAYDRHVGRYGAQLAAGLIDVADVQRGQRALDVGCGSGALTIALGTTPGSRQRCGRRSVRAVRRGLPPARAGSGRARRGRRAPAVRRRQLRCGARAARGPADGGPRGGHARNGSGGAPGWHRRGMRVGLGRHAAPALVLGRRARGGARAGRADRRRSPRRLSSGLGNWARCSRNAGSPTSRPANCSSARTTRASTSCGDHSRRASGTRAPVAHLSTWPARPTFARTAPPAWDRPRARSGSSHVHGGPAAGSGNANGSRCMPSKRSLPRQPPWRSAPRAPVHAAGLRGEAVPRCPRPSSPPRSCRPRSG